MKLLDLPTELLEAVINLLDSDSIKCLRFICRALSSICLGPLFQTVNCSKNTHYPNFLSLLRSTPFLHALSDSSASTFLPTLSSPPSKFSSAHRALSSPPQRSGMTARTSHPLHAGAGYTSLRYETSRLYAPGARSRAYFSTCFGRALQGLTTCTYTARPPKSASTSPRIMARSSPSALRWCSWQGISTSTPMHESQSALRACRDCACTWRTRNFMRQQSQLSPRV